MSMLSPRRVAVRLLALGGVLMGAMVIGLVVGAERGIIADALAGDENAQFILLKLRVPRVLAGAFVGGALACCGAAFQALLRNALASPFVLGVSGGGSLGAVLSILFGLDVLTIGGMEFGTRAVFAFCGSFLALMLIFRIASVGGRLRPHTLLLAGVVVNAFFLAVLGYLNYLATPEEAQEILRWMMGGLSGQTIGGALTTGALAIVGALWLLRMGRDLNVLTLGEEAATRLGVDVKRVRRIVFVLASVMTGAAVAVSGPIGFVGLFVPHGVRLVFGPDHRLLMPASFLSGAAFLCLADALGRVLARPGEMPVGLITAVVGAPCFLVLLLRARVPGRGMP
jgi:iron complex transport system permease protein